MGECRQLTILNKYHKPYENEFREAIKCGEDPKTIFPLQVLREKLGLTRPRKDYVDLMGKDSLDRYTLLIPRKDGTVLIGSTPEVIQKQRTHELLQLTIIKWTSSYYRRQGQQNMMYT